MRKKTKQPGDDDTYYEEDTEGTTTTDAPEATQNPEL